MPPNPNPTLPKDPQQNNWGVLLSFLLVASLGVPVWLATTHIYRADLIIVPLPADNSVHQLANWKIPIYWNSSALERPTSSALPSPFQWSSDADDAFVIHADVSKSNQLEWLPGSSEWKLSVSDKSQLSSIVQDLFKGFHLYGPFDKSHSAIAAPIHPRYHISITLVQGPSSNVAVQWEPESSIQNYLDPFLERFHPMAQFKVSVQIERGISLGVEPKWNKALKAFTITPDQHPHMLPPGEWASSAADHVDESSIQLVLYVPSEEYHPLYLVDENGDQFKHQGFIVNQWGGIVLVDPRLLDTEKSENSNNSSTTRNVQKSNNSTTTNETINTQVTVKDVSSEKRLRAKDLKSVFEIWLTQLHALLGVGQYLSPTDKWTSHLKHTHRLTIRPRPSVMISTLERDALLLSRFTRMRQSTWETLLSLERMVQKMPNMAVSDEIRNLVETSIAFDRQAMYWAEKPIAPTNNHLHSAYLSAQQSAIHANRAFFAPSMLASLYFPDEHLLAVYAPLFVPVAVPVLMSAVKMIKELRRRREQ